MTLNELLKLCTKPVREYLKNWWLERREQHYLVCAEHERQKASEASKNATYYQMEAVKARAAMK